MGHRICIEAGSRWDAIALLRALRGFERHLVQLDAKRFELYVYTDQDERTIADDLRERLEFWLDDRALGQTTVRFADGSTHAVVPDGARVAT